LEANLQNNLKRQLLLSKDFLESQLNISNHLANADSIADRIGDKLRLRATIIANDGTVIGDTDLNAAELKAVENHLNRPEIQEAISKGFGVSKRYSYTIKKYLLYMAVPFGREHTAGFIRLAVPLSDIELLEQRLQKTTGIAFLLILLFSVIIASLISFIISRPLVEMAAIARVMAKGDFSRKPSIYSKDEIGDLAMALSYMSDEIKGKIERIKQEGVKLDAVLASMFEGIMVVDEKGIILLINPSLRKLLFIDSDSQGKTPVEATRVTQVQDITDKILQSKQSLISEEISISRPAEKILAVNGVPIIRNNTLEGAVLVFHDITELRRLERVRQDFVANVSHELRTPIASIKGYAETLLDGAIDDKDNVKEFIGIIHQDSNRLANLIDDLLDLARIESGKLKMIFTPTDIKPILDSCLGVLDKSIKAKRLFVSVDMPKNLPHVLADEKRLSQVFLNLLDNAVKYTPDAGSIRVSVCVNDKLVQADISDTGIGIPEKDLPRIFERFYRVDKARSREIGGTGLGLSIVKHIVLSHNGQVWVKSELGRGSTFSFTIPQV
jgi:two-component system phosphate regulon sensor histidine kinase PhoR